MWTCEAGFDRLHMLIGFRPLYWAVLYNHKDMVNLLLKLGGASIFAEASAGMTPIYLAIVMGHMAALEPVFPAGAVCGDPKQARARERQGLVGDFCFSIHFIRTSHIRHGQSGQNH
jgi:hypothetical protein